LFKAAMFYGVGREVDWPFDPHNYVNLREFRKHKVNKDPTWSAYRKAFDQKWLKGYYRISSTGEQRIQEMKQALYERAVICFGMDIGQAFEDYSGGVLNDPGPRTGGHAMFLYGYYRNEFWRGQNSWGTSWGIQGRFKLAQHLAHSIRDIWVVQSAPEYSGT
jgi:hypothetical protein